MGKKHWLLKCHIKCFSEFYLVNPMYFSLVRNIPKYIQMYGTVFWSPVTMSQLRYTIYGQGPIVLITYFSEFSIFRTRLACKLKIHFSELCIGGQVVQGCRLRTLGAPPLRDLGKRYIYRDSTIPAKKFARAIEFCFTSSEHSYVIGLHCFIDLLWQCHNRDTPIRQGPNRSNKVFCRHSDFQNLTSLQIHRVFFWECRKVGKVVQGRRLHTLGAPSSKLR